MTRPLRAGAVAAPRVRWANVRGGCSSHKEHATDAAPLTRVVEDDD
ncbi:hypothetical protein [Streptomyces sp. NPDC053048]